MNNKILDICIITNKYPNYYEPNILVFVQQLVWQFAKEGHRCTVISPMPINLNPRFALLSFKSTEFTDTGNPITIYRPKYFGLGQTDILGHNTAKITTNSFYKSVFKVLKNESLKPDVLYSHFVTPAGITASRLSKKTGIPSFMAHGEASLYTIENIGGAKIARKELSNLTGVIAVSSYNRDLLIESEVVPANKIIVIPNGYNEQRFFRKDKKESRRKFGLPDNKFIIGFCGSFDERKGILRLEEAVDRIEDAFFICAGKGDLQPTSRKCLYANQVNNEQLPFFYSACDLFVLPTLREGCCNAIIEAMACGLPIISSNGSFNNEILDESNSIKVDPNNVDEIEKAIRMLMGDEVLLNRLAQGSLKKSQNFTLKQRANRILSFFGDTHAIDE